MRTAVKVALGVVKNPKRRYKIWKYAEKKFTKYDFETSPYVREFICPLRSTKFLYPRKDFDKPVYLEFEGHMLPAQHYYKQYLEQVYPGYMNLPPVEKRKQKTNAVFIDIEKGYVNYKGVYYCKNKA